MSTDGREHTLYRLYDKFDELLYIGLTVNLEQRLAFHRSTYKHWFPYVVRVETEPAGTEWRQAMRMEAAAIKAEQPLKNRNHSDLPHWLDCVLSMQRTWTPLSGAAS